MEEFVKNEESSIVIRPIVEILINTNENDRMMIDPLCGININKNYIYYI